MKLSSLPKVTKLISGRTRLQTQGACLNSKHFRIVQAAWFNLPAALEVDIFSILQMRLGHVQWRCLYLPRISLADSLYSGGPSPQPDSSSFPVTGQIFSLKNISTEMSGYYICTSSNDVGTESCNITVAVRPRKSSLGRKGGRMPEVTGWWSRVS